MPSSISSSEVRAPGRSYTRPIAWALVTLVLVLCSFEAWARFSFFRISRLESRTYKDHVAALAVRRGTPAKPSILLLGNSLLLEALDYDRIRTALENQAVPTRFVIEQTSWFDWYYGIRRLLAEGSQPDRIVLCLDIHQIVSHAIRGEYSAFYLIQTADLVDAGRTAGYSLTRISNLFFARYSIFYAGLNNYRNFILNKFAPAYASNLRDFGRPQMGTLSEELVINEATQHFRDLQVLCAQYHTRCDILLPPGFTPPAESSLLEAGKRSGTTILIPVPLDAWGYDMYLVDHYHVNATGAKQFTDLLAKTLLASSKQP